MFQSWVEALTLALPAAHSAALVFVLPVIVLLSGGLHVEGRWTLEA